ncbi:MAG: xanthine dehydrogenase accessory protein XdhC [Rhodobacterales bacterium]|nr:xanthine dehydrogenase accessory protein XdhC [Rhodobacterales bacterium]
MNVFAAAAEAWRTGRRAAFATVIGAAGSTPRVGGARMLVYADGTIIGTIGGGTLEHRAAQVAIDVIGTGRPQRLSVELKEDLGMCCGGRMEVYVEPLQIRHPFVLFGAGHVSLALAPLLIALEFDVTVVDERDELNTATRFPGCTRQGTDSVGFADKLIGRDDAHWLVMTHDHRLDQDLIERLLPKPCAWLGMIGSKAKVARFLVRYRAAGIDPSLFTKLSAPVGLMLGAQTPSEIAVSIAAELVQVRRGQQQPAVPLASIPLKARGGPAIAPALRKKPEV